MNKFKTLSIILLILLFLGSVGGGYYYYDKYTKTKAMLENPEEATKAETESVLKNIGELMELPDGEPTVATVLDKDKLQDQEFFAKAENGDKVVIFAESKIAILYRSSVNKIISFAPVSIGRPQGQLPEDNQLLENEETPKDEPELLTNPVELPTEEIQTEDEGEESSPLQ